jgi:hypothetical protein
LVLLGTVAVAQDARFEYRPRLQFEPAVAPVEEEPAPVPVPVPVPPPLFTRETVAPDTPPLMLTLLNEPTLENAKAFVRYHMEKAKAMQEVQALIRQAAKELAVPPPPKKD